MGMSAKTSVSGWELSLADIAAAYADGRLTSRQLTQIYLDRISALDRRGPELGAVLEPNPQALDLAAELHRERRAHGPRRPLHGVTQLIKVNVETAEGMQTA